MKEKLFDSKFGGGVRYFLRTEDYYILNSLQKLDCDQYLYRLLKSEGYERVVFADGIGYRCKLYTYDKFSELSFKRNDYFENIDISDSKQLREAYEKALETKKLEGIKGSSKREFDTKSENDYGYRVFRNEPSNANTLKEFFINKVKGVLNSSNIKTAIVMEMRLFEQTLTRTDDKVSADDAAASIAGSIQEWEKKDRLKQNILIFVANSKSDYEKVFTNTALYKLHPTAAEVTQSGNRVDAWIENLKRKKAFVSTGELGVDEIFNLLLRKKFCISDKNDKLNPLKEIPVNKIYSLAKKIKEHISLKKKIFDSIPYAENCIKIVELEAAIEDRKDDSFVNELKSIALKLPESKIIKNTDPNSTYLQRVYGKSSCFVDISSSYEEILKEFDEMIGMDDIKDQLVKFLNSLEIKQKKYKAGKIKKFPYMNLRFVGPAGTGKTTVANILGRLFCAKNILSNPEPIMRKAGDYSSDGHVDVMKSVMRPDLDSANNGIILIDEFYNFNKGHSSGNLAKDALEVIMGAADDYKETLCIIVAGYEDDVNETFKFNSGCRSRFPYEIKFRNYSTDELVEIFKKTAVSNGYKEPDENVLNAIRPIIESERSKQGNEFGNARFVADELFTHIEIEYDARATADDILSVNDVISAYKEYGQKIQNSELVYDDILSELDEMIGMGDIKDQLVKFLNAVEINQKKYKAGKIKKLPYMNLRFVGPAGTGKTTVANILGRLFCAKNILSNPEPKEIKPSDYSTGGHADTLNNKMRPVFDSANNGIIFIDEFYNFNKGHSSGNLATEALEVIMGAADDYKETLCIIVAGYEDDVNETFKFNSGCRRRFPYEIKFRDYLTDELVEIFKKTAVSNGYKEPDEKVLNAIRPIIESERSKQGKEFGNAGFVTDDLFQKIQNEYYARAASDDILSVNDVISAYPPTKTSSKKAKRKSYNKRVSRSIFEKISLPSGFQGYDEENISETERRDLIRTSILFISTDKGKGTAFLISPDGYALTCNHVIAGANEINARLRIPGRAGRDDSDHKCTVINTKESTDMALIKLEGKNFPYLPIAGEEREILDGETFTLSGYPLGKEEDLTSYTGYIANQTGMTDSFGKKYRYIEGEAKKGNSGSPLVSTRDGKVIGILFGSDIDDHDEMNKMRPIKYFWEEFLK